VSLDSSVRRLELATDRPFTISRGTSTTTEAVVVELSDDDHTGVGAAAPSSHYGETADTVAALLPALLDVAEDVDPSATRRLDRQLQRVVRRNPAARCAVSIAAHDLAAKRLDVPLYRRFGLDPERTPRTSFTVGIDDPEAMADAAAAATDSGHAVLKVKLGTDRDRERLTAVREAAPDARIRVDANEAWTPTETVANAAWLGDCDVEFLEQPVPAADPEGLRYAYEHADVPIAVDESVETAADVPQVADRADVAVCKLMKCGSVDEAVAFAATAHACGMETMLGCMLESSASIAAGAQLSPLFDYVDLDGSLLLADDPYEGPVNPDGRIDLGERPGTGARTG
jgi:L-alanine-DL-glutamate epimerase-like enolase superfamily enzyme